MRTRIVIVGDLPDRPHRAALLRDLKARHAAIEWEWIQPDNEQFGLPPKYFQKLINQLRTPADDISIIVVKLALVHGRDANTLYNVYPDPVQPPLRLSSPHELIDWIFSAEANLVPRTSWSLPVREVGLLCALSKLVKNKSWNKDQQGHAWTKEADLLGQAPVNRPSHPHVYSEAVGCLDKAATAKLLLTKGGKQGRTPKEWCINTDFLPAVKQTICERNLRPLRGEGALDALMAHVDGGPTEMVVIDEVIVSERVLSICRDPRG